jgi:hypothetical protein
MHTPLSSAVRYAILCQHHFVSTRDRRYIRTYIVNKLILIIDPRVQPLADAESSWIPLRATSLGPIRRRIAVVINTQYSIHFPANGGPLRIRHTYEQKGRACS